MRRTVTATAALLVLLAAGCGGDDGDTEAGGTTEESVETAEATEEMTTDAAEPTEMATGGAAMVEVAQTDLGEVLVDSEGMTLYMFDPDAQGESTCYDACAQAWPPLETEGEPAAGEGAEESLLGTVERDGGGQQVTYNDWPLYYWQDDTAPGETTGQAVNDVWWVLDPQGEPVRE